MMRLARTASLLLALCLLASAATAHAECAWVLWWVKPSTDGNFILTSAQPMEAFKDLADCTTKSNRLKQDEELKHFLLRCLPDTVDPRGPKGK